MNKVEKRILREILSYRKVFKDLTKECGYLTNCKKLKRLLPVAFELMPELEIITWNKRGELPSIEFPNKALLEIKIKQICIRYGY